MVEKRKPKRILEIGTSIGYSATNMALAARKYGGRIITLEYDPKAAAQARTHRSLSARCCRLGTA